MQTYHKIFMIAMIFLLISCNTDTTATLPTMKMDPGSEREIAYTDKGDAFWVTRTGGYNSSPWHGLTASKRAYFEDFFIYADGELLPRESAEISVDPLKLIREYADLGIRETWTLLDKQHTLVIQLDADKTTHWTVQPAILGGTHKEDFEITTSEHELNAHLKRLSGMSSSYPYLKIWFSQPMQWLAAESPDLPLYTAYLTQQADYAASRRLVITVSLNDEMKEPDIQATWIESARNDRLERIKTRLERTHFKSNITELDAAIAWAHASIDALIMQQMGTGIYAGLPWFDDYWGRDVFISFAGAALVSGQYDEARQILLAFSELQNTDPSNSDYGRVPNRAQPEDIIYNTTDGTPWFVRSIWDYYRYTGDLEFLEEMWPAIRHASIGALQNWTDESGLLRHADADTWMDAKGPDGPWSPRGDRAIDIQFIWRDQLEITRRLADKFGDADLQKKLEETLLKLEYGLKQFRSADGTYLVDHLNVDDSQDQQIRPNIFLVPPLFSETCDWSSFKTLAPQLITRNGVLSLSQKDENFHPFHHLPGLYVQDAAYHNGIIWTWNSAATIAQAIRFHQYHYAQALFDNLTDQILNQGAIGTIAELTDAWPRDGQLQLSGTFTQAWSVAEYLRSFYQDILGIQPDLSKSRVRISPRLLEGMKQVQFTVPMGLESWEMEYDETETHFDIQITRSQGQAIDLSLELRHESTLSHLDLNWDQQNLHLRYEKQMGQWTVPGNINDYRMTSEGIDLKINSLPFCTLDTTREIPALQGPQHRLFNEAEVVTHTGSYKSFLEIEDERGDDQGDSGYYIYPSNPQFASGIADILNMQISEDDSNYCFEFEFANLVDPGWHPEYGYQLTYCTMGISHNPETGTSELGKNSQAIFKNGFMADQILYISGGILLVDDNSQPIAEYMPRTTSGAIGDARAATVRFKLPKAVFSGYLGDAQFQIAVGCQDDHGGAGIGDYREVQAVVSEWSGGGKTDPAASNIYDWMYSAGQDNVNRP